MAFNEQAVNGDDLACLYDLNISDEEVVDVDVLDGVFPDDIDVLFGGDFVEFFKLLFLDPVVSRCNCNYDHHCHQDGCALHPPVLPALGSHSQHE